MNVSKLLPESPFARVMLGLGLGVVCGLVFGERTAVLESVGQAYIRLLQVTVLPYILVSLIGGLGRLEVDVARRIGIAGGIGLLTIWGLAWTANLLQPVVYPSWETAAFFSTSLVDEAPAFDPLTLYIPSNVFHAAANAIVPAVVVFAMAMGVALITVDNKSALLAMLTNTSDALLKIAGAVTRLAPFGLFAIAASAAGSMRLEEFTRLQVYFIGYLTSWGLLTFGALPLLVSWTTPLGYRQVLAAAREPMLTAFATGSVLVVLPLIATRCKELIAEHLRDDEDAESAIDVLAPTVYSFPNAATLLGLGFVVFAAWFSGTNLSVTELHELVGIGTFVAFGKMPVAIPYMLNHFSLPADLVQLYLVSSAFTGRFAVALAALNGVVIALLGAFAVAGRVALPRLARTALTAIAVMLGSAFVVGLLLEVSIDYEYTGESSFVARQHAPGNLVRSRQIDDPAALSGEDRRRPRLEVIAARGALRVGYWPDRLPFAYRNADGDVVGLDLGLVHRLADEMGVEIELVRLLAGSEGEMLADGRIDLLVGGLAVTTERTKELLFSASYMDEYLGFLVADGVRSDYATVKRIRELGAVRAAFRGGAYYAELIERRLPGIELTQVESPRPYLRGELDPDTVMVHSAEAGAAWSLIYPSYGVVVPRGLDIRVPIAFAVPLGQHELKSYIDTWLELVGKSGVQTDLYEYWILGREGSAAKRRWSLVDDVIHW